MECFNLRVWSDDIGPTSNRKHIPKQNPINMVTLFGIQVFPVESETQPVELSDQSVMKVLKPECSDKGYRNGNSIASSSKRKFLLDLNETPVNESGSGHNPYFSQDLNDSYIDDDDDDAMMTSEKSGVEDSTEYAGPGEQNNVHTDNTDSPASYNSCCTTETTSLSVQMAAESLLHMSYQHQDQDFLPKPELGITEPQRSCDSYELMTLDIAETCPDDFCVSSMAIDEVNIVGENKELGFKLRRGRRMKNFQKEILPGIASLSRHEIHEDINILEAIFKSREHKKLQGKKEDEKCIGENPRKRRSGQRYMCRRRSN